MKKFNRFNLKRFAGRISAKALIQGSVITMGVCGIVLAGAIVFTSNPVQEDGRGGFDTSGVPVVNEDVLAIIDGANADSAETALEDTSSELSYFSYRIKKGDMIGKIAAKYDVSQDTLISINKIKSSRTIQVGQYIKIPSKPGILYEVKNDGETLDKIAKQYEIDMAECATVNHVSTSGTLSAGDMLFLPGAKLDWVALQEINGDLFRKPIRAAWRYTSGFGYRENPFNGSRSYHNGIDMACPTGTSIYAALPGKVVQTGYSATYGNFVIVAHHSGYKTLYGHMSAILCVPGQSVSQESRIGRVGSTGLSTGPHLHFTVYKNGKAINPLGLMG